MIGIKSIKDVETIDVVKTSFEAELKQNLNLTKVPAPLFVDPKSGLNDTLNGIENAVSFTPKDLGIELEVVHSLAKWKRHAVGFYEMEDYTGILTNMKAIRKDEDLSHIHSLYVEQWDWEMKIPKEARNIDFLKTTVKKIYASIKAVQDEVVKRGLVDGGDLLPDEITFITTEELLQMYPSLSPSERESAICRDKKAVFLIGIGDYLSDGQKHDGRAPDYDDWKLNGDILVYNDVIDQAFELSSMGIRVSEESLVKQLEMHQKSEMARLDFHRRIIEQELPYTIGGGIGESRLIMFLLKKEHIGEVQFTVW